MNKKILVPIGILLLAGIAYLMLFSGRPIEQPETSSMVKSHVAAEGKLETLPGLEVEVGSDLTARIDKMFVKENDPVEKGQLIARLDGRDIEARLVEAQAGLAVARAKLREVASGSRKEEIQKAAATLERVASEMILARKEYDRRKDLYQRRLIAAASLDESENTLRVAAARVKEVEEEKRLLEKGPKTETVKVYQDSVRRAVSAVEYQRKLLDKTFITAPISGKVIRRYLDEGEIIMPEVAMLAIADVERLRINAEIDETDVGRFGLGDPVDITSSAYPGKIFKGRVEEISGYVGARKIRPDNPAVNLGLKVVQVKIGLLEATPFKLGMSVDVKISPQENAVRMVK
ncbi:MAG: HlyD family secretion protein [Pseudomonadota bacterium]